MKYIKFLLFIINILLTNVALADCIETCIEIDNECNTACPTDEGAPPCHLICHIHSCTRHCPPKVSNDKKKIIISTEIYNSNDIDPFNPHKEYSQDRNHHPILGIKPNIFDPIIINPPRAQPEFYPPKP